MNEVQDFIYNILPSDAKMRNNGWIHFCAKCCVHVGENDRKSRGNIKFEGDSVVYNCFNCHYTWGWRPGFPLTKKMKQFMEDLECTSEQIKELRDLINKYNESMGVSQPSKSPEPYKKREIRSIPSNYKSIKESLKNGEQSIALTKVVSYIKKRNPRLLEWADLMWAEGQLNFLIPCYEFGEVVGYTLRSLNDKSNAKYVHYTPSGYVHNFDSLLKNRKYNILVEGDLDSIAIDGIGLLSNEFTPDRLKRILAYNNDQEIIVVPDRDKAGKKIIDQILQEKLPFSVSFPNWERGIKDVEEAVRKYGRLYTIYDIINSKETDPTKIKFKSMTWFNN